MPCSNMLGLTTALLVTAVAVAAGASEPLTFDGVKCRTCVAAMDHLWQTGEALRRACEANPRRDRLCRDDDVQSDEVVDMVAGVCKALPTTHSATHRVVKLGDEPKWDLMRRRNLERWRKTVDADPHMEVTGTEEAPNKSAPGTEPFFDAADSAVITDACAKALYERHGSEKIAGHVFSHLEAGRKEHEAMRGLRRRFCFPVCGNGSRRPLKAPRWDDEL